MTAAMDRELKSRGGYNFDGPLQDVMGPCERRRGRERWASDMVTGQANDREIRVI